MNQAINKRKDFFIIFGMLQRVIKVLPQIWHNSLPSLVQWRQNSNSNKIEQKRNTKKEKENVCLVISNPLSLFYNLIKSTISSEFFSRKSFCYQPENLSCFSFPWEIDVKNLAWIDINSSFSPFLILIFTSKVGFGWQKTFKKVGFQLFLFCGHFPPFRHHLFNH